MFVVFGKHATVDKAILISQVESVLLIILGITAVDRHLPDTRAMQKHRRLSLHRDPCIKLNKSTAYVECKCTLLPKVEAYVEPNTSGLATHDKVQTFRNLDDT